MLSCPGFADSTTHRALGGKGQAHGGDCSELGHTGPIQECHLQMAVTMEEQSSRWLDLLVGNLPILNLVRVKQDMLGAGYASWGNF